MPRSVKRAFALLSFAARVSSLGATWLDRAKIYTHVIALRVLERTRWRKTVTFRLTASGNPYAAVDRSDYNVLKHTFLDNDFEIDIPRAATIVDLGAHAGSFVIYLRNRYPQARIVAVEPSPSTFNRLMRNVAPLKSIELVNAAVSSQSGSAAFDDAELSWGSKLADSGSTVVRTITFDDLRREHRLETIDVLKVDIEGAEWDVFRRSDDLQGVKMVIGELHGGDAASFFLRFPQFDSRVVRDFGNAFLFVLRLRADC